MQVPRTIPAALIAATLAAAQLPAQEPAPAAPEKKEPARVEVVFVLDTTGSMSGLIAAAKQKIWSIANTIARVEPTPELKIGLVAYRDRKDEYVTKVTDLTDNLDQVYLDLQAFQARGGGDGPEDVRRALQDALTKVSWSKDRVTLKVVYLVGDAPPHLDYEDVPTLEALCERAARSDVVINTVRCGGNAETQRIWQDIARRAEGRYASIAQGGGVVAVATPHDGRLAELSDALTATMVAFGSREKRGRLRAGGEAATSLPAAGKADRAGYLTRAGAAVDDDLVEAVEKGRVELEEVEEAKLPEPLRKMNLEQRRTFVKKKADERAAIQKEIAQLTKKREQFIRKELEKRGAKNAFDAVVLEGLREQARKKGLRFGEPQDPAR